MENDSWAASCSVCVLLINDFYHLISLLLSKHSTVKMRILAECKSLSREFSDISCTTGIFFLFSGYDRVKKELRFLMAFYIDAGKNGSSGEIAYL